QLQLLDEFKCVVRPIIGWLEFRWGGGEVLHDELKKLGIILRLLVGGAVNHLCRPLHSPYGMWGMLPMALRQPPSHVRISRLVGESAIALAGEMVGFRVRSCPLAKACH